MNISSQSDILTNKLFMLASNKYGAPYCGSSLKDDTLAQGVRFWVSGIAVGSVGIPGNTQCLKRDSYPTAVSKKYTPLHKHSESWVILRAKIIS